MKRISFLMITFLMAVGMVMAQAPQRGERQRLDPKARAEKRTERMATEYGLNDTQKAKLLELNVSMAEKMGGKTALKPSRKNRDVKREESKDATAAKPKMTKEQREQRMAEMKKVHESYQASLKEIFTADQYQKFEAKQAQRQQKMKDGQKDRKDNKGRKSNRRSA